MIKCYKDFGFYKEKLVSLTKKGISGAEEISQMMKDYKANPVKSLDGSPVITVDDYNTATSTNLLTGKVSTINLPTSNVLIYTTEDGTRMAARPSGTEPKIKFYFSVNTTLDMVSNYQKTNQELEEKLARILKQLKLD